MQYTTKNKAYQISIHPLSRKLGKGHQVCVYKRNDKVYKIFRSELVTVPRKTSYDIAQVKLMEIETRFCKSVLDFLYNEKGIHKGYLAEYIEPTSPLLTFLSLKKDLLLENMAGLFEDAYHIAVQNIYMKDLEWRNAIYHKGEKEGIYTIDSGLFEYVMEDSISQIYKQNCAHIVGLLRSVIEYSLLQKKYSQADTDLVDAYLWKMSHATEPFLNQLEKDMINTTTLEDWIKVKILK